MRDRDTCERMQGKWTRRKRCQKELKYDESERLTGKTNNNYNIKERGGVFHLIFTIKNLFRAKLLTPPKYFLTDSELRPRKCYYGHCICKFFQISLGSAQRPKVISQWKLSYCQ